MAEERDAYEAYEEVDDYDDDDFDDYPDEESLEVIEPEDVPSAPKRGKHGAHGKSASDAKAERKAEKKRKKAEVPEYMRKSHRMRKVLIVIIILLVVLLAVGGYFVFRMLQTVQSTATQQAQITSAEIDVNQTDDEAKESNTSTARRTTVPNLMALFGLTQDEAVTALEHGAQVSTSREVSEQGNPIVTETRVALTAEPSDSHTSMPTVYLGLDAQGKVIQAGYSASTSALGYGSFSFADAVRNVGVVEQTLNEAGLAVPEHSVELPEDKMAYSVYASDGITLTSESCDFAGSVDQDGGTYNWSAVLSYDYSMANATGNLADTMRTIYVYIATF